MPEGDSVWRTAHRLHKALAGSTLTRCDIRVPRYATVDLTGCTVDESISRGKHLLTRIGDATIHTHLKMEGSWHVYTKGQRWREPAYRARIILATEKVEAVGFSLGKVEVLTRDEEDRVVGHLGPDLLGPDWDADEAVRRLLQDPQRAIGLALLDQRNLAGIGNIFRSEACFLRRVDPRTPTGEVDDLHALVEEARRILTASITKGRYLSHVYGRARMPCHRCGSNIVSAVLTDNPNDDRHIYLCPHCLGL
jgi:endonuclease VIII